MEKSNTNDERMRQLIYLSIMAIIGIVAGFFLGRDSADVTTTEETFRYIKGDTIKERVKIRVPYKVDIPTDPIYIYKTIRDTFESQMAIGILTDWIKNRHYKEDLFKNEYGELSIDATVQYYRLNAIDYSFVPIEKQIVLKQKRVFQPFIEASYSTLNYVSLGGGAFYNDLSISLKYSTDFRKKGMDIGLKYKS